MIAPASLEGLSDLATTLGLELVSRDGLAVPVGIDAVRAAEQRQYALLRGDEIYFDGTARECAAFLIGGRDFQSRSYSSKLLALSGALADAYCRLADPDVDVQARQRDVRVDADPGSGRDDDAGGATGACLARHASDEGPSVDPVSIAELTANAQALGFECAYRGDEASLGVQLHGNEVHFGGTLRESSAFLGGWSAHLALARGEQLAADGWGLRAEDPGGGEVPVARELRPPPRGAHDLARGAPIGGRGFSGELTLERLARRDQRQGMVAAWAETAFGREEATGLPQRGLRLLEEAIEAFQACGGNAEISHELVTFVFGRPAGTIGQELGGVAVTVLGLAAAAGLSADEEECREVHRVLSRPVVEFSRRNAAKNAAGFKISQATLGSRTFP